MGWGSFDDQMPMNPKIIALSDGAFRLWMNILAYCNRHATKGLIPKGMVPSCDHRHGWSKKQIDGFVREMLTVHPTYEDSLLIDEGPVFRVHDYELHQQYASKQHVVRAHERERKADLRKRNKSGTDTEDVPDNVPDNRGTCPIEKSGTVPTMSLARERSRDPEPHPNPKRATLSQSARVGPGPDGIRAERLRVGYLDRFLAAASDVKPDPVCHAGNGGPWLELARELTDAQVDPLLDAFFADETAFVACDRAPSKIKSQRVRLLGQGPTVNGHATKPHTNPPTSPLEAKFAAAAKAAKAALMAGADAQTVYDLDQAEEAARRALAASRAKGTT